MLRHRSPNALDPFHSLGPHTEPAVKSAPAVSHSRTLAKRSAPVLGPTATSLAKVSNRVPVLEPCMSTIHKVYSAFFPSAPSRSLQPPAPEFMLAAITACPPSAFESRAISTGGSEVLGLL